MIVVNECKHMGTSTDGKKIVYVEVFADELSELQSGTISDLPENSVIRPGSIAYDANLNVAVYSSTGWEIN